MHAIHGYLVALCYWLWLMLEFAPCPTLVEWVNRWPAPCPVWHAFVLYNFPLAGAKIDWMHDSSLQARMCTEAKKIGKNWIKEENRTINQLVNYLNWNGSIRINRRHSKTIRHFLCILLLLLLILNNNYIWKWNWSDIKSIFIWRLNTMTTFENGWKEYIFMSKPKMFWGVNMKPISFLHMSSKFEFILAQWKKGTNKQTKFKKKNQKTKHWLINTQISIQTQWHEHTYEWKFTAFHLAWQSTFDSVWKFVYGNDTVITRNTCTKCANIATLMLPLLSRLFQRFLSSLSSSMVLFSCYAGMLMLLIFIFRVFNFFVCFVWLLLFVVVYALSCTLTVRIISIIHDFKPVFIVGRAAKFTIKRTSQQSAFMIVYIFQTTYNFTFSLSHFFFYSFFRYVYLVNALTFRLFICSIALW